MKSFLRSCIILTSLSPLAASAALAQTIPSTAEPSRTDRLRSVEPRPQVSKEPLVNIQDTDNSSKALKGGATFTLTGVDVQNATVFAPGELESIYSGYIGKKASLATLNEIAAKITAYYRNAGYILSRAVVAPQHIKSGRVTIRIIEGYVDRVIFQGNKTDSWLLNGYADKIRSTKPLSSAALERYLLLMEDLPGVSARATLRPSPTQTGATDVIVTLTEKPFNVALTADNRGTRYLGQGQVSGTVAANNMLGGLYEKTQVRLLNTTDFNELHYGEIRHEEQLDSDGTKLALSAARTRSEAGYNIRNLNVIGHDTLLSAEVKHPFIRSRETNLYGTVDFDHRDTRVRQLGTALYEDHLNVLRVGSSYDFVDQLSGVNRIDVKGSKGFGWNDDSDTGRHSRASGNASFESVNGEVSRLQPIAGPVSLLVSGIGQASDTSLLSSEQFGVGGANYGSAYDPSEITGDSGISGRTELQYTRQGDVVYVPSYQLYGFYDVGTVWRRAPGAGQKSQDSLASTGLGVRFNTNTPVTGGVEFSVPLTRKVAANGTDGNAPRIFFNLGYQY